MRLGLNLAVFGDRPLERALADAARLGVETVELNLEGADALTPLDGLGPARLREIRRLLADSGLRVSALGNHAETQLIGGPHHADTDRVHAGTAAEKIAWATGRLLRTAELAAELEVGLVIGFVGCEDWSRWFPWPDPRGWEAMLPPFVERWRPILDRFAALGPRFAHEPHPKQLAYDTESALAVSAALDHPSWGYNLDAANLQLTGASPAAFVAAMPERVLHVHAKDLERVAHHQHRSSAQAHGAWDRPDRGIRFRVPGWGQVDWRALLSELQLAGYEGSVSIEHEDPLFSRDEGARKAVDFLAPLLPREPRQRPWW